jgi:cation transport ATPase
VLPDRGISGMVEAHAVAVGNARLMADLGIGVDAAMAEPIGAAAMPASSVSVVTNAVRLRRRRLRRLGARQSPSPLAQCASSPILPNA